ncbi:MAG: DNA polymerase III subunit delta' [Bifidobacteriaceae bacterium]|jgi:DNA polymerase-3 subunit delta'|nr:DNA polymerase III subunit delta' [Bifidobacteriaceae bacterium]
MSVWDAVTGQDQAIGALKAACAAPEAMTHAWLITGPPGSGRSVAARVFAAAAQCAEGGCGQCHECRTVMAGTHPDVKILTTESVLISVAQVRELVGIAARAPSTSRWRIVIVEDADRMTERTSNVLLKAIEEPPSRTIWLLAAPSPRDVIVTIRSRCRPVALRIPSVEAVTELLVRTENVAPDVAREAAMAAQCHIGIARRLATDPAAREQRERVMALAERASSVGGAVIAAGELVDLAKGEAERVAAEREAQISAQLHRAHGLAEGERAPRAVRAQIDQALKGSKDDARRRTTRFQRDVLDRALVDLMSFYRDVLTVQERAGIDLVNLSHSAQIARVAETSTVEVTLRRIDAITQARERLAGNVAPALAIEAMAVGVALAGVR